MSAPTPPTTPNSARFRRYAEAWLPAALWMGVIFYLSSRSTLPGPKGVSGEIQSILGHFIFFGVLALCMELGFRRLGYHPLRAAVLAVAFTFVYGAVDELHQAFVPGRNPDPMDVWVDTMGALAFVFGRRWLKRLWRQEEARANAPEPPTVTVAVKRRDGSVQMRKRRR